MRGRLVDVEGHGGLRLGPDARDVLRGERSVELRRDPARRRLKKTSKVGKAPAVLDDPDDEALFQALRARRMEVAKAQGVPPYVIFHDSSLREMALRKPRDLVDMAQIPGVGQAKLERYGDGFLAAIAEAEV